MRKRGFLLFWCFTVICKAGKTIRGKKKTSGNRRDAVGVVIDVVVDAVVVVV